MKRRFVLSLLLAATALWLNAAYGLIFVEETINVGMAPKAILYDSVHEKVFTANFGSATVSVINPATNTVTATISVEENPMDMCFSPTSNKLYVLCSPITGNGKIVVIDPSTNTTINTITVGMSPMALVWSSGSNKAYTLNNPGETGNMTAIDVATDQVLTTIGLTPRYSSAGIGYNPRSNRVYATSNRVQYPGQLTVVDCETDQVMSTITCGNNTMTVGVNLASNRVYAANTVSKSLTVVNGESNQRIGQIQTRQEPTPLLWVEPNKLFVGEYWDSTVAYLGGDELSIPTGNRIKVGGECRNMILAPDCQQVFCALVLRGRVAALDARDGHERLLDVLPVGNGPQDMVYYQPQQRVFVANSWDSTVTVIRTEIAVVETRSPLAPSGPALVRALPSPAWSGRLVRFAVNGLEPTRLTVRDADGRLVHSATGKAVQAWQTPGPGVYFCTLGDGARSAVCKLAVR
ncbi:YncE family protein [candidate division WOR-3 bacterium]|nr:YncE family protein [candidate division WOR-3 bacterium]